MLLVASEKLNVVTEGAATPVDPNDTPMKISVTPIAGRSSVVEPRTLVVGVNVTPISGSAMKDEVIDHQATACGSVPIISCRRAAFALKSASACAERKAAS